MQPILGQLLHAQPPGRWARYGDRHVGFAARQVEHPWQGHDLNLQIRVLLDNFRNDLWQKEIRNPIRRAQTDLARQLPGLAAQFLDRATKGLFDPFGMGHQPLALVADRISLRGFSKQHHAQGLFQPGDPPSHRGGIHL